MPADTAPSAAAPGAGADRSALNDIERVPGVPKPDPILVADGVRRQFGGLVAVDVDHVEFQRGMITALIGPNGAGKTTFFNLLTGFDEANGGAWKFNGESMDGVPSYKVARKGMIRTFQLTCKRYPKSGQASRAHSHLQNKYNINVTLGGTEEE